MRVTMKTKTKIVSSNKCKSTIEISSTDYKVNVETLYKISKKHPKLHVEKQATELLKKQH